MMQPVTTKAAVATPHSSAPQERGNGDVLGRAKLAVGLHDDPSSQIILQQYLMGFGQTQLPRQACMLDRSLWAGTRASVIAADQDDVGLSFGHTGGNRADANFGHQLDRDPRIAIGVLQIVDQLGQVFDRVNIVMRRWRDQTDTRRTVTNPGNLFIDLMAGKLPAFARLGALAILICNSSALHRYSLVTPNRPLATCLIALLRRSPLGSLWKRAESSPPSPVLLLAPMRFIAMASVS